MWATTVLAQAIALLDGRDPLRYTQADFEAAVRSRNRLALDDPAAARADRTAADQKPTVG